MDDEIEQNARAMYETQDRPSGSPLTAWEDLDDVTRALWRDLAQGDAGAAVD